MASTWVMVSDIVYVMYVRWSNLGQSAQKMGDGHRSIGNVFRRISMMGWVIIPQNTTYIYIYIRCFHHGFINFLFFRSSILKEENDCKSQFWGGLDPPPAARHSVISDFDLLAIDQRGVNTSSDPYETEKRWGKVPPCPFTEAEKVLRSLKLTQWGYIV